MQLVAYGAQDIYLTANPQITFWKVVYRRHTNFAIESIEQVFNGEADFGKTVKSTISRNADLINQIYLEVELPALQTSYLNDPTGGTGDYDQLVYTNAIGHALMKKVSVEIGGQEIDKQYGEWLEIWDELTQTSEKQAGFNQMIGKQQADIGLKNTANISKLLFIPLQFWFNRNPGLALPLIALQYHEVKICIDFRDKLECLVALRNDGERITSGNGGVPGAGFTLSTEGNSSVTFTYAQLWVDYVYLDTEERRRFAQESHEYLIDQLQMTGVESITLSENKSDQYRMNFNHPVKELVWVFQRSVNAPQGGGNVATNDWFNFSTADPGDTEPVPYTGDIMDPSRQACKILLNGHDRFATRSALYFRLVQPYQSHTRIPSKHIYVYSFGLRPEEHQPSGTCNFSRIDNAQLVYKLSNNTKVSPTHAAESPYGDVFSTSATGTLTVYARNYNVLRIMSGMGGVRECDTKSILPATFLALLWEKQLCSKTCFEQDRHILVSCF